MFLGKGMESFLIRYLLDSSSKTQNIITSKSLKTVSENADVSIRYADDNLVKLLCHKEIR